MREAASFFKPNGMSEVVQSEYRLDAALVQPTQDCAIPLHRIEIPLPPHGFDTTPLHGEA